MSKTLVIHLRLEDSADVDQWVEVVSDSVDDWWRTGPYWELHDISLEVIEERRLR